MSSGEQGTRLYWRPDGILIVDDKLVNIAGNKRGETKKAIQIYDGAKTEWVPKQFVEDNDDGTFTMPEWLAKEKCFI